MCIRDRLSLQNAEPDGPVVSSSIMQGASSIQLNTSQDNTLVVGSYIQNHADTPVVDPFEESIYYGDSGSSWGCAGYQNEAIAGMRTYSYANSDGPAIIAWGDWSTPNSSFKVNVGQQGDESCFLFADWNGQALEGSLPLTRGKWHHLVVATTGTLDVDCRPVAEYYVDGVQDPELNWLHRSNYEAGELNTLTDSPAAQSMVIGMGLAGPLDKRQVFRGELDELHVIRSAISAENVLELFQSNQIPQQ